MVAKLKDKGLIEVRSLRKRAMQVAGLGRCSKSDSDYIVDRCNEIEVRIQSMKEKPMPLSERGNVW